MAKRISALLLMLALVAGLCSACDTPQPDKNGKLRVVTTTFAPYDFARAVAGGLAEVTMLLPPASESHTFEPTPQDIIKILNCDVFVCVGGESDEWVRRILDSMDAAKMTVVTLMDCVDTVEEEAAGVAEAEEGEDPELDEHVWTSPQNAGRITQKISDAMCAADPQNAAAYQINTTAYLTRLDALDKELRDVVSRAKRKTIVFGDRFPFRYFADAYGLDYLAAFPGCSAETEPSVRTVMLLIDKIRAEQIPVVFHVELSNESMAKTISKATGAQVLLLHACHNISTDDYKAGKTYLDLMQANVAALKTALY